MAEVGERESMPWYCEPLRGPDQPVGAGRTASKHEHADGHEHDRGPGGEVEVPRGEQADRRARGGDRRDVSIIAGSRLVSSAAAAGGAISRPSTSSAPTI